LIVILGLQHQSLRRLRAENVHLSAAQNEAGQLKADPAQMESWQDVSVEISNLQAQSHDLPKLRNEVRGLREQVRELDALRAENARLRSQAQRSSQLPQFPPFLANLPFLGKDSLTNAGFATPEAAAQTYFWSIREADQKIWMTCLTPSLAQHLKSHGTNDLFRSLVKQNPAVTGYVFRDKQAEDAGHVRLMVLGILDVSSGIVTSADGQTQSGRTSASYNREYVDLQLRFQKLAGEWKLEQ